VQAGPAASAAAARAGGAGAGAGPHQALAGAAPPAARGGRLELSNAAELDRLRLAAGANRYAAEPKGTLFCIGLSVHTAPVEMRERLATPAEEWNGAIGELTAFPHIEEAAVLSTCNRMELYIGALSWHRGLKEVESWLCQKSGLSMEELRPYLFLLRDRDATKHLLRVSAGLDSLVMGEGQILAQVKSVHEYGQEADGYGRHLNGLFKQAIQAGKRVRTETSIASGAVSVSSAAAELCQMKLPTHCFNDARICIIGAGKMTRLLVKHLASKGCARVTIVNRSMPRCEELAADFPEIDFEFALLPDLLKCVGEADAVFAASSSEELLVTKSHVEDMGSAPGGEAVGYMRRFFDISVPRNIAPDISEVEGAHVYNVDDLKEVVEANKDARARAAAEAENLLQEEQQAFEAWKDSLETVPTIKKLRMKAEAIRTLELDKAMSKLGGDDMTKKERKALEELSRGIINKLLHGPMQALRCDGSDPSEIEQTLDNMHAMERVFDLGEVTEGYEYQSQRGK